jgi:hypothetical protein
MTGSTRFKRLYSLRSAKVGVTSPDGHTSFSTQTGSEVQLWGLKTDLVFAFTMASMLISDLRVVGQLGATIGLGLLVDTFIVRSFMTPSIAAARGRWFWWPLNTFRTATKDTSTAKPDPDTEPIPQLTTA